MTMYHWKPMLDLPDSWKHLASEELRSLSAIWKEQKQQLKKPALLKEFNDRLGREWAIETGIIEGLYSIDRGTTQVLIEHGLVEGLVPHYATNKPAAKVIAILRDHESTLEGIFDFVSHNRSLSTSYIKEAHAALTQNQLTTEAVDSQGRRVEVELLRGDWKLLPNSPVRPDGLAHEYCPPEHTAAEMDRLVRLHIEHEEKGVPPEVEAAWLHHRFTQIHPFQDGNGRVARVLASLVLLRAGWFPLVIHRDLRIPYIEALEKADNGDLAPLVQLFSDVQKRAFLKALTLLKEVSDQSFATEQVLDSIEDRLKVRRDAKEKSWQSVFGLAGQLEDAAERKLGEIRDRLDPILKRDDASFFVRVFRSNDDNNHWFRSQIISIARELDYYADTNIYRSWVRLRIQEERRAEIVFSFHSFGYDFIGLMAASAFIEFRSQDEEGSPDIQGPYSLSKDVFQFAYNESQSSIEKRFRRWLEETLTTGLEEWRKQL